MRVTSDTERLGRQLYTESRAPAMQRVEGHGHRAQRFQIAAPADQLARGVAAEIQSLAESIARAGIKAENYALAAGWNASGTAFFGRVSEAREPAFFLALRRIGRRLFTVPDLWNAVDNRPVSGSGVPK
jgi:hypothetical protein